MKTLTHEQKRVRETRLEVFPLAGTRRCYETKVISISIDYSKKQQVITSQYIFHRYSKSSFCLSPRAALLHRTVEAVARCSYSI